MIRFAAVSLGSGGVAPCVRCVGVPHAPVEAGFALTRLAAVAAAKPDGIVLVGLEPFTHPSLVELITAAGALDVPRVGIQTDGAALGMGQNAPGSVGAGVRFFEFVFLGDAETHDRLAGRVGASDSLIAGIGAVKRHSSPERRIFVGAVVKVCRHNVDRLADTVAAAVTAGVRSIRLEVSPGVNLPREAVDRAHAVATTAGVALFGDSCGHLLNGVRLYDFIDLADEGEVARD